MPLLTLIIVSGAASRGVAQEWSFDSYERYFNGNVSIDEGDEPVPYQGQRTIRVSPELTTQEVWTAEIWNEETQSYEHTSYTTDPSTEAVNGATVTVTRLTSAQSGSVHMPPGAAATVNAQGQWTATLAMGPSDWAMAIGVTMGAGPLTVRVDVAYGAYGSSSWLTFELPSQEEWTFDHSESTLVPVLTAPDGTTVNFGASRSLHLHAIREDWDVYVSNWGRTDTRYVSSSDASGAVVTWQADAPGTLSAGAASSLGDGGDADASIEMGAGDCTVTATVQFGESTASATIDLRLPTTEVWALDHEESYLSASLAASGAAPYAPGTTVAITAAVSLVTWQAECSNRGGTRLCNPTSASVAGALVSFGVLSGDGSIGSGIIETGLDGSASNDFVMGQEESVVVVTASAAGAGDLSATITLSAPAWEQIGTETSYGVSLTTGSVEAGIGVTATATRTEYQIFRHPVTLDTRREQLGDTEPAADLALSWQIAEPGDAVIAEGASTQVDGNGVGTAVVVPGTMPSTLQVALLDSDATLASNEIIIGTPPPPDYVFQQIQVLAMSAAATVTDHHNGYGTLTVTVTADTQEIWVDPNDATQTSVMNPQTQIPVEGAEAAWIIGDFAPEALVTDSNGVASIDIELPEQDNLVASAGVTWVPEFAQSGYSAYVTAPLPSFDPWELADTVTEVTLSVDEVLNSDSSKATLEANVHGSTYDLYWDVRDHQRMQQRNPTEGRAGAEMAWEIDGDAQLDAAELVSSSGGKALAIFSRGSTPSIVTVTATFMGTEVTAPATIAPGTTPPPDCACTSENACPHDSTCSGCNGGCDFRPLMCLCGRSSCPLALCANATKTGGVAGCQCSPIITGCNCGVAGCPGSSCDNATSPPPSSDCGCQDGGNGTGGLGTQNAICHCLNPFCPNKSNASTICNCEFDSKPDCWCKCTYAHGGFICQGGCEGENRCNSDCWSPCDCPGPACMCGGRQKGKPRPCGDSPEQCRPKSGDPNIGDGVVAWAQDVHEGGGIRKGGNLQMVGGTRTASLFVESDHVLENPQWTGVHINGVGISASFSGDESTTAEFTTASEDESATVGIEIIPENRHFVAFQPSLPILRQNFETSVRGALPAPVTGVPWDVTATAKGKYTKEVWNVDTWNSPVVSVAEKFGSDCITLTAQAKSPSLSVVSKWGIPVTLQAIVDLQIEVKNTAIHDPSIPPPKDKQGGWVVSGTCQLRALENNTITVNSSVIKSIDVDFTGSATGTVGGSWASKKLTVTAKIPSVTVGGTATALKPDNTVLDEEAISVELHQLEGGYTLTMDFDPNF